IFSVDWLQVVNARTFDTSRSLGKKLDQLGRSLPVRRRKGRASQPGCWADHPVGPDEKQDAKGTRQGPGYFGVLRAARGRLAGGVGVKAMGQAAAIDVEGLENLADLQKRQAPVQGPQNDVQVFLTGFETIENAIEQEGVVVKAAKEQTEVAAVEFHPEAA